MLKDSSILSCKRGAPRPAFNHDRPILWTVVRNAQLNEMRCAGQGDRAVEVRANTIDFARCTRGKGKMPCDLTEVRTEAFVKDEASFANVDAQKNEIYFLTGIRKKKCKHSDWGVRQWMTQIKTMKYPRIEQSKELGKMLLVNRRWVIYFAQPLSMYLTQH